MAGNPLALPFLQSTGTKRHHRQNGVVAAIDISLFTDVDAYKENADQFIEGLKALPRVEDAKEILVPGEPEDRVRQDRLRSGIPLPEGTVRNLERVAGKYGVKMPEGL